MADHAPVIVLAGNHGKELEGDLYPLARVRGRHAVYLSTEPELIELDSAAVATFPYPRKAELAGSAEEQSLHGNFVEQMEEFDRQLARRPGSHSLFFGHFGVAGAKVSSGQPLVGRGAEYPLDPLRQLRAQYIGLSHIHLRQELAPRVWYAGSLSRCDYSEREEKGYNLVTLKEPGVRSDLSDLVVDFRVSPTRMMVELHAVYENGEYRFAVPVDRSRLKDARVKVVVTVAKGLHESLGREEQDKLRDRLLEANPAELKIKIEHEAETGSETSVLTPPLEQQERLIVKLGQVEAAAARQAALH